MLLSSRRAHFLPVAALFFFAISSIICAEAYSASVLGYAPSSGTQINTFSTSLSTSTGIAAYSDGLLYGVSADGANIFGYLPSSGALVNSFSTSLSTSTGIAAYSDGLLYGVSAPPIPLPAAFPLFATALAGMGLLGWRRKRKAAA